MANSGVPTAPRGKAKKKSLLENWDDDDDGQDGIDDEASKVWVLQ